MLHWSIHALVGYLSGSLLFAHLSARLLRKDDICRQSPDRNPGTANAFQYGGFLCGVLTLLGDVLKGLLPVAWFTASANSIILPDWQMALVLSAPVIGHAFPIFYGFRGGKGIATSFGCLLGLLPDCKPVLILAIAFLLYVLVIRISPHRMLTISAFLTTLCVMAVTSCRAGVIGGFALMTLCTLIRIALSNEQQTKVKVKILWMS